MANAKISDAAFVVTTDVTTIDGLAGYAGVNNVKISGSALIASLDSNLNFAEKPTLRNVNSTTTFATPNETINCFSNTFVVNLPLAGPIQGVTYTLVNTGTGTITLTPNVGDTINGSTTIDLSTQYISRTVQSDGTNWIVI